MNYLQILMMWWSSVSNVRTWIKIILGTIKIPVSQIGEFMETLRKTRLAKTLLEFDSSINSLRTTGLFLYPLKTSKNLWFSDIFLGYRKRPLAWDGLMFFLLLTLWRQTIIFFKLLLLFLFAVNETRL